MALNQYTSLSNLDSALLVTKYDTKLRRRAIYKDIYAPGVGAQGEHVLYKRQEMAIPNAIYQKISPESMKGSNNVRVGFKVEINANILRARTVAVGREVAPVVKHSTLYRNNYRFVVQAEPEYGVDRLDAEAWDLYDEHVRELSPHAAAEEGLEIRQALVEGFGWNLWVGDTTTTCQPQWNPHVYVAGINNIYNQPLFHPDNATYTNRIVGAINTASGGNGQFAQTASQMLNGYMLDDIARFALARRLFPLMINGNQALILSVSPLNAARFSNPNFTDTLGDRWVAQNRFNNDPAQRWIGTLGVWMSATGVNIYLVRDERLPTLLPSGTAEPFGLSAGYVWPQQVDLRNLDNSIVRDCSILHGQGAIVNFEPEKLHFIRDDYDYMIRIGKGYAGVRGIQRLEFDATPAGGANTNTTINREYFGSALVVLGRDNTGTV